MWWFIDDSIDSGDASPPSTGLTWVKITHSRLQYKQEKISTLFLIYKKPKYVQETKPNFIRVCVWGGGDKYFNKKYKLQIIQDFHPIY